MSLIVDIKQCTKCKVKKSFSEFHKQAHGKFGLRGRCIQCAYAIYKEKYMKECSKRYREKYREKIRANNNARYWADPDKANAKTMKSRRKHYDKYLEYSKKYEAENKEARLLKSRTYAKNNPHKVAEIALKRRTKEKNATPIWTDTDMTKKIYKLRDRLNNLAGYIKYHVDHVIPLNAKIASGLHVYNNLKIELATVNMSKRNTFEGIN